MCIKQISLLGIGNIVDESWTLVEQIRFHLIVSVSYYLFGKKIWNGGKIVYIISISFSILSILFAINSQEIDNTLLISIGSRLPLTSLCFSYMFIGVVFLIP